MSVLVCGKRSPASFFEDEYHTPVPASKRIRCASALHFSPPAAAVSSPVPVVSPYLDHLRSLFPHMDQELLERALEVADNDLDIAIKNLNNLHLESADAVRDLADSCKSNVSIEENAWQSPQGGNVDHAGENGISHEQSAACNLPTSGSEWVELIVREMSNASNMDDARVRASMVLEGLEKSIVTRARAEATESQHKENVMLKEQLGKLLQENDIWKRGFRTLHGQKEAFDRCSQELQQLKHVLSERDEQLRKLQMENYELKLRLVQEQQRTPIPRNFHPDVFG